MTAGPPSPHAPLVRAGVALALLIALLGAFSGYQQRTFDAYVHMFFADHYLRGWFELWEPRWYGGFSVTTYPPLAHQLVALAARLVGHEAGFVIVMGAAMIATPLCVAAAARAFIDEKSAALTVALAALWPTAHRFAYVYGQLPTLFAAPLVFLAMRELDLFFKSGRGLHLAAFTALIGATAGTHHVSIIFAAGGAILIGARRLLVRYEDAPPARALFVRTLAAALCAGTIIALVVWPFLIFAKSEPQTEIPHISREPLLLRPFSMELVEIALVLALSALLTAWATAKRRRAQALLGAGVFFLALLSTGATTPLPRLLFGAQWRWLTYDKFQYWSALLAMALAAAFFTAITRRLERVALGAAVVLLPWALLSASHKLADALQPPFIDDIAPLLEVLNQPGAEGYRHLTLGFGDQLCRLDIYGRSPSVDGDYHTARHDPVLRASGIGTVDAAKYYDNGPATLRHVLAHAAESSLRWVFVTDTWYYPFLFDAGFELKEVWENGVTLFVRDDVPAIAPRPREPIGAAAVTWGVLPLACLMAAIGLIAWGRWH